MKKISLLACLLLSFFACEKELEVDGIPGGTKLVLNSLLNPDSLFRLEFSTSGKIDGSFYPRSLKDVKFVLEEDGQPLPPFRLDSAKSFSFLNNPYLGALAPSSELYYFVHDSLKPKQGSTYRVIAQRDGFPEISSSSTLPGTPVVEDIDLIQYYTLSSDEVSMARLRFTLNDSAAMTKGYALRLRFYFYGDSTWHFLNFISPDPVIIENKSSDLIDTGGGTSLGYEFSDSESAIFSAESFQGTSRRFELYLPSSYFFDTLGVRLDIRSLNEEYYSWLLNAEQQKLNQSNPFSQPVQITGNIENGLGIFAGTQLKTTRVTR